MINTDFFDANKGIVTLCGSTRFFEECLEINRLLTFKGWIVLMCGSWGHSYHKDKDIEKTKEEFERVKKLHFIKILKSSAIVVVSDESLYYGNSTKAEIEFSRQHEIPIFYFNGQHIWGDEGNGNVNGFNQFLVEEAIIQSYTGDLGF